MNSLYCIIRGRFLFSIKHTAKDMANLFKKCKQLTVKCKKVLDCNGNGFLCHIRVGFYLGRTFWGAFFDGGYINLYAG